MYGIVVEHHVDGRHPVDLFEGGRGSEGALVTSPIHIVEQDQPAFSNEWGVRGVVGED